MSFVPVASLLSPSITPIPHSYWDEREPKPLFKKFKSDHFSYAYDTNTGVIIQLNEAVYELLEYLPLSDSNINRAKGELGIRFAPERIADAAKLLSRLIDDFGLFRPVKIASRMIPPEQVQQNLGKIVGNFGQLVLSVAEQCNLRCSYCSYSGGYVNTRVHNSTMMSWSIAQPAIDLFLSRRRAAPSEVSFYGGEPLINFALVRQAVDYVKSRATNVGFGMTTNATLFTPEIMDDLAKFRIRMLISLDGPEAIHDRERRFLSGQTSFKRVINNARALQQRHPEYFAEKVRFWCTLRPDEDDLDVLRFFVENDDLFGHGKVGFGRVSSGHSDFKNKPNPDDQLGVLEHRYVEKALAGETEDREFSFLSDMFQKPYFTLFHRPIQKNGFGDVTHSMGACFPGNHRVFVKADGTFQVCEKSNDSLVIGNVRDGLDLDRISAIYKTFYELHNRECTVCWAYRFCPSCYVSSTRDTGHFEKGLDPQYCNRVRGQWQGRLSKYSAVLEIDRHAFDYLLGERIEAATIPVLDEQPKEV